MLGKGGRDTKFIEAKTGVLPKVEVSESADLVVRLEGGTAKQIERARLAVEVLIASRRNERRTERQEY